MRKAAIVLCCLALLAASCGEDESALSRSFGRIMRDKAEKSAQKLNVGMTHDEVRAVLGDPDNTHDVYWSYHLSFLWVIFQDGKVVDWTHTLPEIEGE